MAYTVFLFDLDGTLLDTSPGIFYAMRRARDELGLPDLSDEIAKRFIGPPITEPAREYYGMDEAGALAYHEVFARYYAERGVRMAEIYPEIERTLDLIHAAGCTAGVATAKPYHAARGVLEHFGLLSQFDCLAAVGDHIISKGEIIQNGLAELGVTDRAQVVMFGDSVYDGRGAAAAGVDFAAALYGFGFYRPGALEELAHVAAFDTSRQLFDWVKANLPA